MNKNVIRIAFALALLTGNAMAWKGDVEKINGAGSEYMRTLKRSAAAEESILEREEERLLQTGTAVPSCPPTRYISAKSPGQTKVSRDTGASTKSCKTNAPTMVPSSSPTCTPSQMPSASPTTATQAPNSKSAKAASVKTPKAMKIPTFSCGTNSKSAKSNRMT
jgi:hypothetical protein